VRILFATTILPGAVRSGGEVASNAFVGAMRSLGHDVVVLGYRRIGDIPPTHPDDVAVGERHIETDGAGARPALWMARAVVERRPYSVAKYVSRRYARAFADQLRLEPALVVVDHAQIGWLVPRGGWRVPHVYLAHNVEHRLYSELAAAGGLRRRANLREAALVRRAEEALCRGAGAVWALTADDADALAGMGAGGRVAHFDLPPTNERRPQGGPVCDVALLGSWTWRPNAAGLEWFLREVRPLLPADMTVEVGGAASAELAGGVPGVAALGKVPDALAFLQSATVVAVPSVAGAGVQVKTLDAIASGRRVVATATAMRGISGAPPTVAVAADAAGFAEAVRRGVEAGATPDVEQAARDWVEDRRAGFRDRVRGSLEQAAAARSE
jgi:hypothetical protein